MHRYAAPSPEARELISELEFVWDQIKSNTASSSSSGLAHLDSPRFNQGYSSIGRQKYSERDSRLRVLSPVSQPGERRAKRQDHKQATEDGEEMQEKCEDKEIEVQEDGDRHDDDDDDDEFQEAQDSFYRDEEQQKNDLRQRRVDSAHVNDKQTRRWQRRIEQALTKMTTEIVAMRELIESRTHHQGQRKSILKWIKWLSWVILKQLLLDIAVLGLIYTWMRFRGDRRLETMVKSIWKKLSNKPLRICFLKYLPASTL
ncbi:hypothetical protein LOY97_005988 [Ophidiomyces ophidiicola]|nr:hypothetical protein LOZ49_005658 [Ophidiomyces ophidiicola]KAI2009039.1 hypothetical protein LOZ46_006529 [Ophidiomyces ophidiicola]KAI2128629.1 hypothetical protein LOZ29_006329 [Ophidiomyces ophidiicola]KAI2131040.1 hypothetical protein LOZ28_006290 [Ophidiomyces ophidiicola]KAI2209169.1 hypothetical protein LOZ15_006360 [Ophidiomyces ophidiicola]